MNKRSKAILCVITRAAAAGGVCGVFKVAVPIPLIEVGGLTAVTKNMCKKIAKIYHYDGLSGISTLIGVAVGAALGVKLATELIESIPGIGAVANVASTVSLHLVTGAIMIVVFELLDDGVISKQAINDEESVIGIVNRLMGGMTDIVGKLFRGDFAGAMSYSKKLLRES